MDVNTPVNENGDVKQPRVVALIPARGGSKRIPRKNVKVVAGKPLIAYSILAALQAKNVSDVVVSTDEAEIMQVALQYGARILERPAELAEDDTPMLPVLQHAVQELSKDGRGKVDYLVLLQPTNPLRTVKMVERFVARLLENTTETVTSAHKLHINPSCLVTIEDGKTKVYGDDVFYARSQDIPQLYHINGLLYGYQAEVLLRLEKGSWSKDNGIFVVDKKYKVDIDTEEELVEAGLLLEKMAEEKRKVEQVGREEE